LAELKVLAKTDFNLNLAFCHIPFMDVVADDLTVFIHDVNLLQVCHVLVIHINNLDVNRLRGYRRAIFKLL